VATHSAITCRIRPETGAGPSNAKKKGERIEARYRLGRWITWIVHNFGALPAGCKRRLHFENGRLALPWGTAKIAAQRGAECLKTPHRRCHDDERQKIKLQLKIEFVRVTPSFFLKKKDLF